MGLQGPGGGPHSTGKTSNAISLKFVSLRQLESLHSAVGFQYPQACCLVLLSNLFHRLQAVYYIPAALFAYLRVRKGVLEPAAVVMENLGRVNKLWEPQSPSPFHCNRWVVAVRWWGCGHSSLLTAPGFTLLPAARSLLAPASSRSWSVSPGSVSWWVQSYPLAVENHVLIRVCISTGLWYGARRWINKIHVDLVPQKSLVFLASSVSTSPEGIWEVFGRAGGWGRCFPSLYCK